jgi:hypothetical protein
MNSFTEYGFTTKSFQTFSDNKPSYVQKSTSVGSVGTIVLTDLEKKQLFNNEKKNK